MGHASMLAHLQMPQEMGMCPGGFSRCACAYCGFARPARVGQVERLRREVAGLRQQLAEQTGSISDLQQQLGKGL